MMLIMLINLGSTLALEAILSLSTVALYLSYLMPITFFMIKRWQGDIPTHAPFRLGKWGLPINLFALAFGIFMIIFLPFPTFLPLTWNTMNYAGPILGAIIIFSLIDWFTTGKRRFVVPTSPVGAY
jgi:choline transport protein